MIIMKTFLILWREKNSNLYNLTLNMYWYVKAFIVYRRSVYGVLAHTCCRVGDFIRNHCHYSFINMIHYIHSWYMVPVRLHTYMTLPFMFPFTHTRQSFVLVLTHIKVQIIYVQVRTQNIHCPLLMAEWIYSRIRLVIHTSSIDKYLVRL